MSKKYTNEQIYTTYKERVLPYLDDIERMIFEGYTFDMIANDLHVDKSLLWKMMNHESCKPLACAFAGKKNQIENTWNALYRQATGYYVKEQQAFKLKKVSYNSKGKKIEEEYVKVVEVDKFIPANTMAAQMFLFNKDRNNYKVPSDKEEKDVIKGLIDDSDTILIKIKEKAEESK